jgi:hypothetical protein
MKCPMFCQCDACSLKVAVEHGVADAKCGREWTCQCGACKRARIRSDAGIDVNFARLEYLEEQRRRIRAVLAL